MIDLNNIPPNWTTAKLGEVCDNISLNGIKIKQKQYLSSGKFPVIDQGQTLIGGYHNEDKFLVTGEPPFIVFGDHTKVKKYVNFKFIAGADGIKVLKPHSVFNPKFFYYLLFAVKIPDRGYARHFQFLVKEEIPLPPLPEQHRIVSKLEELFTELDKGIEQLQTAQQQLKVYRQAVLKWAFEGKFLKNMSNWQTIQLGNVANAIDPQPSHRTPPISKDGIPYISIKDVDHENDSINFSTARKVSKTVLIEHLERYKLHSGDFIIGKIGTIGKPVRIVLPQEYTLSANVVLIQPRKINNKFLYYLFQSDLMESQFRNGQKATAQAAFGIQKVRTMNIPYPEQCQQEYIVHEIESRLSVCDKIEETIADSLQQAEALRQSILKKAFEGKLVPQDPNDEPAERLLERIRAEKKAAEQRNVYRKNTKSNPSSVGAK